MGSRCQKPNWKRWLLSLAMSCAVMSINTLINVAINEKKPSNRMDCDPEIKPVTMPAMATANIRTVDCLSRICSPRLLTKTPFSPMECDPLRRSRVGCQGRVYSLACLSMAKPLQDCVTGISSRRLMLMCAGVLSTQKMVSAMSSG